MSPSKPSKRSKGPSGGGRSRSFGGCATCRMRHIKCDEGRPSCLMCKHFGIPCGGYDKSIFFTGEDDHDGIERFRRPLFTEEEREQMSTLIVSSLPVKHNLLSLLSQIDEECENGEPGATTDLFVQRGPFGAFKIAQQPTTSTTFPSDGIDRALASVEPSERSFSPSAFTLSPRTQEMFESFVHGSDHIFEMSPTLDIGIEFSQSRIEELFGDVTSSEDNSNCMSTTMSPPDDDLPLVRRINEIEHSAPLPTKSFDAIPLSTVKLLKHYSSTVIGLLTPSRHSKTLWHILFIPHIKASLAALSMREELDHASLCSFYGTLAISAFHMTTLSSNRDWHGEGQEYKQKAQNYLRLALHNAYNIPKVAKYKSILMAILTMVQLSTFDGDWKQTECYLLEAEKFIRLRGLHGRKSRKRRLLHHCYAFMRLFHESLFLMTTHSLQRIHVRLAVESSGLIIIGGDRPSFRLSPWNNLVQKMLEVKSPIEGENDLHLERPGFFSSTMYPEIYGLPEEWLVMLSQVIRLGNEKEPSDGASSLSLKEFSTRAKDLEQCIVNWHRPPAEMFCTDQQANNIDERVLHPLLDALHQALVIYFYRRIYDVDASMLQKRVERTRDSLEQCDKADSSRIRYTSVFIWPAFISACEAEDPELRSTFNAWFEDCVKQGGQSSFRHMHAIVNQVWHQRDAFEGSSVTWLDFMKDSNVIK